MTIGARLVMLAVVMLTRLCVDAQSVSTTTGAINGTVTDATKAVLPGVTITLSSRDSKACISSRRRLRC